MTSLDWHTTLSEADQHQLRDVIDAATASDGVAPVGDQVLRELPFDRTRHLVASDGDRVVGYLNLAPATADAPPMAEAVVRPEARRRGVGAALISSGLTAGGAGCRVWAHGNIAAAKATAAALELDVARELLQMSRTLSGLPELPNAAAVTVRTYAGTADDAELLRVNNAAFSWHPEQGGWTEAELAERRGEGWFDPAGLFLAYDDESGGLLGFHWTKVHSTSVGEVYVVGVDPAAQGRGLGKLLTLIGLRHLAELLGPDAKVILYVEANNSAAVTTYEHLGFDVFSTDVAYTSR